jgi:hypothetical protein
LSPIPAAAGCGRDDHLLLYSFDVDHDNPNIGLDEMTRNCSDIFLTWSKFPDLQNGVLPEPGWYPNYVYAMLPKTKKHLTQKCEAYKAASTQFRQNGRKAYIRGYMHGFCHKANMFTDDGRPSSLDFIPFVEIMDVDWVSASSDGNQNFPATQVCEAGCCQQQGQM